MHKPKPFSSDEMKHSCLPWAHMFFSVLRFRSTCGQRLFFPATALVLPPREEVCANTEDGGIWGAHPSVKCTHNCWRPSSDRHNPRPLPQVKCQSTPHPPANRHPVMCWHGGSRWESRCWLMVQWAPRGVFISTKQQSRTILSFTQTRSKSTISHPYGQKNTQSCQLYKLLQ